MKKFKWFLLTGFFSGLIPKAPGTFGSLVGCLIAYLVIIYFPNPNLTIMLLAVMFSVIGIKFVDEYEKESNVYDDKRIVIDEIAGVLIAIGLLDNLREDTLIKIFLSFVSFRLFDIYKPSIIKKVDNIKGGIGVMGDDILAGIFGGIFAGILYMIYLDLRYLNG